MRKIVPELGKARLSARRSRDGPPKNAGRRRLHLAAALRIKGRRLRRECGVQAFWAEGTKPWRRGNSFAPEQNQIRGPRRRLRRWGLFLPLLASKAGRKLVIPQIKLPKAILPLRRQDGETPPEGGGGRCPRRAGLPFFPKKGRKEGVRNGGLTVCLFPACKIGTGRSAKRRVVALCGGRKSLYCLQSRRAGTML